MLRNGFEDPLSTGLSRHRILAVSMSLPSQIPTELVPTTVELLRQCPRLRILVLGKTGAGKSKLINHVFGVDVTAHDPESRTPGDHDIDKELKSDKNHGFVLHDSKGFESGEEENLNTVLAFIKRRSEMLALHDRLHAIWLCIEIPFAGQRMFETGDEELLREVLGKIPIFVVFTKLDLLYGRIEGDLLEEDEKAEYMLPEEFNAIVSRSAKEKIDQLRNDLSQKLGAAPSTGYTSSRPGVTNLPPPARASVAASDASLRNAEEYVAMVSTKDGYTATIEALVSKVLEHLPKKVWFTWAMAQRASASANIEASIEVGRRGYWPGPSSNFIGVSMLKYLDVLCKDILCTWNMYDPHNHLRSPEFSALVFVIIRDLYDSATEESSSFNKNFLQAVAECYLNPAVRFLGEWFNEKLGNSDKSLRCLMGLIVDLTLIMDTVFWLTQQDPAEPLTRKSLNTALMLYNDRKDHIQRITFTSASGRGSMHRGSGSVYSQTPRSRRSGSLSQSIDSSQRGTRAGRSRPRTRCG
ncbi:hypothetical protein OF83DRAFT_123205 [Amylostereum chailletii]|nr:hypothetical protein OF83DRAFT_123205 [Amylostereum chailletii]